MSRLAKRPIPIPKGVEVQCKESQIEIKGPKGHLALPLLSAVAIQTEEGQIWVNLSQKKRGQKKFQGLYWALVRNMVQGVSQGFEKRLTFNGVGFKAVVVGKKKLDLQVGYSHPTGIEIPEGIEIKVDKNIIIVMGIDKQKVGQTAASIRRVRPPEPYKGKGIRYEEEYVRKKAGKAAAKGGAK